MMYSVYDEIGGWFWEKVTLDKALDIARDLFKTWGEHSAVITRV